MRIFASLLSTVFLSVNCYAGVIDELKNTSASKYEVGVFKLAMATSILTAKTKEKRYEVGDFDVLKFTSGDEGNLLYLQMNLEGKAKYMNEKKCQDIQTHFYTSMNIKDLSKEIFPGLSAEQYKSLETKLVFRVKLVSRENSDFAVSC